MIRSRFARSANSSKIFGKRHTILISSHILPEVEMTCNRIIVIQHGRILASDTTENLVKTVHAGGLIKVEVRGPDRRSEGEVASVVADVAVAGSAGQAKMGLCRSTLSQRRALIRARRFFKAVASSGWTLRELTRKRTSLEDIFVEVMREEDEAEEERRESRGSVLR